MDAADRAILRQADDAYADAIGHVSALTATGTITVREAVKRACADLADKGILSFTDRAGRRWHMDTYAEMATLTALHRASVQGYTEQMSEYGYDLAMISSHEGACPICAAWQGVIISVSGETRGYRTLSDAQAAGVFHPRCLHHISIYRQGITPGRAKHLPSSVKAPSDAYSARTEQRYMERKIRQWKRRQAAATTPEAEREARNRVTQWQAKIRAHIAKYNDETPHERDMLLRQYYREGGRVKLSEAAKKLARQKKKKDLYRTTDDPIRDVLGSIKDSHPEEMERIKREARAKGVEIISRPNVMAYAPGLSRGKPGQLYLSEDDSYGAWLHEEQHMLDDEKDGWLGFSGIADVDYRARMEYNAYKREIELARQLKNKSLEEKLVALYRAEIQYIGGVPIEFE